MEKRGGEKLNDTTGDESAKRGLTVAAGTGNKNRLSSTTCGETRRE